MERLSFRRRPRKCRNPCRAWIHPIQDQFRFCPLIDEKTVPAFKIDDHQDNTDVSPPSSQQLLPEEFKNFIKQLGATEEPVLVIEKLLYESDVSPGAQRFSIPCRQVVNEFLSEAQRFNMDNNGEEIDATLIGPSFIECKIKLRKWYYKTSASYVLVRSWKEVVKRNGLKPRTMVQLWSFKKGSQLYFALIKV